jgi:nicotinate-nucleotide adenylyltransferase
MQIGLLGGSFNPPHYAHLSLAQQALKQLSLDRLDLMPAGLPWQKIKKNDGSSPLVSSEHRLAMCQLAVKHLQSQGVFNIAIEACETQRMGHTYTVDTLRYLRTRHSTIDYTLIMGADQANRLDTWHNWSELLRLCRIAVVARDNQAVQFPPAVMMAYPTLSTIDILVMPAMAISSTLIRTDIAQGHSILDDVPDSIANYIAKHSLYQKAT